MAVEVCNVVGNPLAQVGMEQALSCQGVDGHALPKRARQADVGTLEEGRLAGFVKGQELAHLRVQARVREGVRRQLVA